MIIQLEISLCFFFLVNSFKSVLPLQQVHRTLLSCYSKSVKLLLILLFQGLFIPIKKSIAQVNLFMVEDRVAVWHQYTWQCHRCLSPCKLLKEFDFTWVLPGIEEIEIATASWGIAWDVVNLYIYPTLARKN